MTVADEDGIELTPEQKRRRRARNIAIAAMLVALVGIFYLVTLVRLGGNIASRTM